MYAGYGRTEKSKAGNDVDGVRSVPPKDNYIDSTPEIKIEKLEILLEEFDRDLKREMQGLGNVAKRYIDRFFEIFPGEPKLIQNCPSCGAEIIGGKKGRHCTRQENEQCYKMRQAAWKRKERS